MSPLFRLESNPQRRNCECVVYSYLDYCVGYRIHREGIASELLEEFLSYSEDLNPQRRNCEYLEVVVFLAVLPNESTEKELRA